MDIGPYVLKMFLEQDLCSHFEAAVLAGVRHDMLSLEYRHKIKRLLEV